jgi:hypothetical protein
MAFRSRPHQVSAKQQFAPPTAWLLEFPIAMLLLMHGGCDRRGDGTFEVTSIAPTASSERSVVGELKWLPLARDSQSAQSAARFERTSPEETGLKFVHEWNPPADEIDRLNSYAVGVGVAIGDVDDDGLPDVFLACPTKGGRLFRNLGGFRFEDVTAGSGMAAVLDGMWATGCTFVDIDGDNDLDLYVCGYNTENRLFINNGRARFTEEAARYGLDFQGASVMMAFADYDGDGDLDAYLLTNYLRPNADEKFQVEIIGGKPKIPEKFRQYRDILVPPPGRGAPKLIEAAQYDVLYRNDGNATFTDVTEQSGIGRHNFHGLSATWWDCNSDTLPDLYVANDYFGPDRLYVNNGDGTFTDRIRELVPHVPWFSMGADSADINNDGLFDFIATDMSSTSRERAHVTMGELSTDSWFLDFAEPRQYMRNALYLNSGANRFMEIAHLAGVASTDWTWTAKFADLDGDGWVDLLVTNGMVRDFQNSDLKNANRMAAASAKSPHDFWERQSPLRERNLAFRNTQNCRFENVSSAWGLDHLGISLGAACGDLDADGDVDLVVNNFGDQASVYRNHSQNQHYVKVRLQGPDLNRFGIDSTVTIQAAGQIQSRYLTLSRGFMSSDEPVAHFGIGQATGVESLEVRWRDGALQAFSNLPADRLYVVSKGGEAGELPKKRSAAQKMFARKTDVPPIPHREREYDDFAKQPLLPHKLSQFGPGLACGDVNGDDRDDLYLCGAAGERGQLFLATATGFEPTQLFDESLSLFDLPSSDAEELAAVFFDLEGDGDLDLYVVTGGVEADPGDSNLVDRLLVNQGKGRFLPAPTGTLPAIAESGSCACAADFDRDGDLDLFVGGGSVPGEYPVAAKSYLLLNNSGKLSEESTAAAPEIAQLGLVKSALWSDVDDDGWIDLLVAQEWGPITLLKNVRGRLVDQTHQSGVAKLLGWWNGIAGRDLDNDGDIDYVVTNFGLNSKYRASADSPALLFYGDFDGSGKRHIVEATTVNSEHYPLRSKQASEMAMPILEAKFPNFAEFASATLAEVYDRESLAGAMRLEANTLESGLLVNDGAGHFEFVALPGLAQAAPGYGVQLSDFNADGRCDVLLAQNFFGPQRETGRMDGGLGLLLLGEEDAKFQPVWPYESGIVIPDDAKSLLVADINDDCWPDFAVGINNGDVQIYENLKAGPGRPLVVRLSNCPGNPDAAGARVELRTKQGKSQAAEVSAGGSYLTQSGGDLYFGTSEGDGVATINVRWPDGRRSTVAPGNRDLIVIDYAESEGG